MINPNPSVHRMKHQGVTFILFQDLADCNTAIYRASSCSHQFHRGWLSKALGDRRHLCRPDRDSVEENGSFQTTQNHPMLETL